MTQCPIILYLECFNLLVVVCVSPPRILCKANSQIIRSVAWSQNMKEFKSKHRVSHVIHIRASVSSMGKIIIDRACMRLLRVPVDFTWWLEATKGALVSQAKPAKPNYTQQTQADD